MKLIIDIEDPKVKISSGTVSNIFKTIGLKEIKFEESLFYKKSYKENMYDHFNKEKIIEIVIKKTSDFMKKNEDQFKYNYQKLCIKNMLLSNHIKEGSFKNEMKNALEQVLNNKEVIQKIDKLKKLKSVNCSI